MNIHEYQAKALFEKFGVPVPKGAAARSAAEFDAAIDHNELVAPPAGAVGRGDAFVLAIANKVNATVVSNDSYQEFHGEYPWLFDGSADRPNEKGLGLITYVQWLGSWLESYPYYEDYQPSPLEEAVSPAPANGSK